VGRKEWGRMRIREGGKVAGGSRVEGRREKKREMGKAGAELGGWGGKDVGEVKQGLGGEEW